jgi:hypothetical protein
MIGQEKLKGKDKNQKPKTKTKTKTKTPKPSLWQTSCADIDKPLSLG